MQIQVSPVSQVPIYAQIKDQIREAILSGRLQGGIQLPSIRLLAKEVRVGVITVKRAYDDLVEEGFLLSQGGKGFFVASLETGAVKQMVLGQLEEQLRDVLQFARQHGIQETEIYVVIEKLQKEEDK